MLHGRLQLQQHHLSWSSTHTAVKVHVWIWFVPMLSQCYCWPFRSGCATRYLCVPFLEPPEPSADVSVDISSSHASVGASSLPHAVLHPCPCCLPLSCGGSPWGGCWFCLAPAVVQGGCCVKSKRRGAFCPFGGSRGVCAGCALAPQARWEVSAVCTLLGMGHVPPPVLQEQKIPFHCLGLLSDSGVMPLLLKHSWMCPERSPL